MISHLLNDQLVDLRQLMRKLESSGYTQKSAMLGNNSIGQHIRHIIELVQCLLQGYESGCVNYDARKRDLRLETDRHFAIEWIETFINRLDISDKPLLLEQENSLIGPINSSYYRELFYNIEHAIHHMALIRVALREMKLEIVDDQFGVAPSTIKYLKKTCAQ